MASSVLTPTSSFGLPSLSSSSTNRSHTFWSRLSNSAISSVSFQDSNYDFSKWVPQPSLYQIPQWTGLKRLGISSSQHLAKLAKKVKCRSNGVYMSLFGVGAPEALVIGVVALLVFGPKGLAEVVNSALDKSGEMPIFTVARNLGKTLRAFQPTIKELQEVSREFKSTLEKEIGLDDIQSSTKSTFNTNPTKTTSSPSLDPGFEASRTEIDPNGSPSPGKPFSSEAFLKITEQQLKAAAAAKEQEESKSPVKNQSETQSPVAEQQLQVESSAERPSEIQTQPQVVSDSPQEAASAIPSSPGKPETDT